MLIFYFYFFCHKTHARNYLWVIDLSFTTSFSDFIMSYESWIVHTQDWIENDALGKVPQGRWPIDISSQNNATTTASWMTLKRATFRLIIVFNFIRTLSYFWCRYWFVLCLLNLLNTGSLQSADWRYIDIA